MDPSCPSCASSNAVIYVHGEKDSSCLNCGFTWWQSRNIATVAREVLDRLPGLEKTEKPDS